MGFLEDCACSMGKIVLDIKVRGEVRGTKSWD
jgi:hypothetical protein